MQPPRTGHEHPGTFTSDIAIRPTRHPEREHMVSLYKAAGWWTPDNDSHPEFVDDIASGSYWFVGAFSRERMIGMGRILSDGVSDAYIQDVTVLPEYRRRGIGGRIITALVEKLREDRIEWIGLVGEPGTSDFYKQLGFDEMQGSIAYVYKR